MRINYIRTSLGKLTNFMRLIPNFVTVAEQDIQITPFSLMEGEGDMVHKLSIPQKK
jgi:hypothetical protein